MPNWTTDLSRGKRGEDIISKRFNCQKADGRKYDLITPTGKTLEVKTDFYRMKETPNFAIERFSNSKFETDGGIYKSAKDGVDRFAYFFFKDRVVYFWEVVDLMKEVEKYIKLNNQYRKTYVRNEKDGEEYYTLNYLIPRRHLEGACFRVETIDKKYF